ncbi:MAG TPA: choice-of-anchor D domain-containing protein [Solirubrobacteraceae bacterium]|nr:choice-of-anchor D domain-containing protein [Solirubrobacteraceae bacterium]
MRIGRLRRPRHVTLVLLGSLLAAVSLASPASAAAKPPARVVTLVSEPPSCIGQGVNRLFTSGISVHGNAEEVEVEVKSGEQRFSIDFAAPSGEKLADGTYNNAERFRFEHNASPGLSVSGDGDACNEDFGRFVIKDIHFNPRGKVNRFWANYEQHCERTGGPAVFGEISANERPATTPEAALPSAVEWPLMLAGTAGYPVPVTITGQRPGARVTAVRLEGADAGEFGIAADGCEGDSLAPGANCVISVAAKPKIHGTRTAELVVDFASGAQTRVALAVPAEPMFAFASANFVTDTGDALLPGGARLFDTPDAVEISHWSSAGWVTVLVERGDEDLELQFASHNGMPLEAGEYAGAESWGSASADTPVLSVSESVEGQGRGCSGEHGRFIVKDVHVNAAERVDRFWALFESYCGDSGGAPLIGEVRVGEPPAETPETTVPTTFTWPATAVGARAKQVPITVIGGEAGAQVAGVALRGDDAGDFRVTSDECEGAVLAPGAVCELDIAFTPSAAGTLSAELVVSDASGAKVTVPLTGEGEPPPAPPMTSSWATLVSETDDPIGAGQDLLIDANEALSLSGDAAGVEAQGKLGAETYAFRFAPPAGQELEAREYTTAEVENAADEGRPLLSVSGNGRACPQSFGRFTIKEIHFNDIGEVDRLWALYEQSCERTDEPALFGEVRVGAPASGAPELVAPAVVYWPSNPVTVSSDEVPVTIGAGESGADIADVKLGGEDPADFEITSDDCRYEHAMLWPFARCEISVKTIPLRPGTRRATLTVTDASGESTTVQLKVDATLSNAKRAALDQQAEGMAEVAYATTEEHSAPPQRYEGLTPSFLAGWNDSLVIAPSPGLPYLSEAAPIEEDEGFSVTTTSVSDDTFTIIRRADGTIEHSCTLVTGPGEEAIECRNGTW